VTTHVDDFINSPSTDPYASFVLLYFRQSAVLHAKLAPFMAKHLLFCTYDERRWRVTGALSRNFKRDTGYDERVDVAECSAWGAKL
jgi:hypothetical protein